MNYSTLTVETQTPRCPSPTPLFLLLPALLTLSLLALTLTPSSAYAAGLPVADVKHEGPVDFESEILPIFKSNCLACHNQTKAKADLVLETPQTILKGGSSGAAVVPGKPEESYLFEAASHTDEDTIMPPKNNKVAASNLSPTELGLIKLWITEGAKGEVRSAGPIEWQALPKGINPIYAVALSPDGQYAACGRANQIFVYHLPSQRLVTRLTDPQLMQDRIYGKPGAAHRDLVHALQFSPDGSLLASSGYREVKLWRRPHPSQSLQLATDEPNTLVTASPDGHWIATASGTNITLWNKAGEKTASLSGHSQPISSLAFSPNNQLLLSGSLDKTIRTWNVKEGKPLSTATTPSEVNAVAWLADGKEAASGGADHLIRTWQVPENAETDFKQLKELKGHNGPVTRLATIPPHPEQLLSASQDGSLQHWDTKEAKVLRKMEHGGPVQALAVRPNGTRFASAGDNKLIHLWDAADGKKLADLKGDILAQIQIAQLERSQTLADSEVDYQKKVLKSAEETEKKETARLKKADESLKKAGEDFTAKETALADAKANQSKFESELATQKDLLAKVTKAFEEAEQLAKAAESEAAEAKAMSSLDKEIVEKKTTEAEAKRKAAEEAKATLDNTTKETTAKEKELDGKIKEAEKAVAKADGELKKAERTRTTAQTEQSLATKSVESSTQAVAQGKEDVKTAEDGKTKTVSELESAKKHSADLEQPINTLAFSPDNLTLVSGGDNQRVHSWNAETGAPLDSLSAQNGKLSSITFINNNRLLTSGTEGKPTAWDINAGWKLERTLGTGDDSSPFVDRVVALGFSPDGTRLATGGGEPSRSGEILVFGVADGKLQKTYKQTHSDTVLAVEFAPNGKYLASAAADRFIRVTDLSTDKTVKAFEGHTHHVLGVSWKADGRTLASAGADNVIKVWDFVTGERKKNVEGYSKEVTSIHFVGISDQAISTAGDSKVRMINESGGEVRKFGGPNDFVYASAVTPDGKTLIAGGEESTLYVWNASDGKSITTFPSPAEN